MKGSQKSNLAGVGKLLVLLYYCYDMALGDKVVFVHMSMEFSLGLLFIHTHLWPLLSFLYLFTGVW